MKRDLLLLLLAAFVSGGPAFAHHNFAPGYVMDREMTIEGTLVQFAYKSPHSFLYVDISDQRGKLRRWAVEWASGAILAREGVKVETLKPGDKIIVTGNPGRDPFEQKLRMITINRPADRWKWTEHH